MSQCQPCHQRARTTNLTSGRICPTCTKQLHDNLHRIGELAAMAAASLTPAQTATGNHTPQFESRPPINIDAIDPELATIELWRGDPSSAVPILEMLEMWEISIRHDRNLAPYGMATANSPEPALTTILAFLQRQLPWITSDTEFPVGDFYDHINRAVRVLNRWDIERQTPRWGLRCPNTKPNGELCRTWIRWEPGADDAQCEGCNRVWNVGWLMRVAGDVWLDSDTIAHLTGIPRRTIQHWGQRGKVSRRGLLYRLGDITSAAKRDNTARHQQ